VSSTPVSAWDWVDVTIVPAFVSVALLVSKTLCKFLGLIIVLDSFMLFASVSV
jgi:hypothetical protein